MKKGFWRLMGVCLVLAACLLPGATNGLGVHRVGAVQPTGVLRVGNQNDQFATLEEALEAAQDGDTITVQGGSYAGPIIVEKAVRLLGIGEPVIDGHGQGTVVTLAAPDAVIEGFVVRGSGAEPDRDHAGITLEAARTQAINNRVEDVLFGIFVAGAEGAVVRGNEVSSKLEFEVGRRGDGIRVWYSQGVQVMDNHIHDARDVVVWYSKGTLLAGNRIENGRYGVHLMYCDGAYVENNVFFNNSVGIYVMYTNQATIRNNLVRGQHGPNGYALGFKDADDATIENNVLVDNHAGVFLDGTPYTPHGYARFTENVIAYNDAGVTMLPAVSRVEFTHNTFWENVQQMTVQGGGASPNIWKSNYWSDYEGYDLDGDGLGDTPYVSERLFEDLSDREPLLRALLYSPTVQAIEFAASSFPIVRPQPKLTDATPLSSPADLPEWAIRTTRSTAEPLSKMRVYAALVLVTGGVGIALAWAPTIRRKTDMTSPKAAALTQVADSSFATTTEAHGQIIVRGVSKRYGKFTALSDVSLTIQPGQSLALWGANGAGKTTLLKAMLGLLAFTGEIRVGGYDVRRQGKAVRKLIGYVPQEFHYYDLNVQETMRFYAALKQAGEPRISALLAQLGLSAHAHKRVGALSGGLRQRLALAVALLSDPSVLLLDEPMANLDARARKEYLTLLATLRAQGKTLVCATHRIEEVSALCDQALVLEHGRRIELITPEQLLQQALPEVELTLWVRGDRAAALRYLQEAGFSAHLNGRGTVVVQVKANHKMQPIALLEQHQVVIEDFDVEQAAEATGEIK